MAAIAPERTIKKLPTERNFADLTAAQQELHWTFMGLLGYEGTYTSRLRLNQPGVWHDESVPWSQ